MQKKQSQYKSVAFVFSALFQLLVFGGTFTYFYRFVNPVFVCQWQNPVFFLNEQFFSGFVNRPGGLLEYASALITQLYSIRALGALLMTLISIAMFAAARQFFRKFAIKTQFSILVLIPSLLMVGLISLYLHSVSVSLVFLISVAFANGFFRLRDRAVGYRLLWAVLIMVVLFYLVSTPFLLFVLLVCLYEILQKKNWSILLLLPLSAAVLYLAGVMIYPLNKSMILMHLLPFQHQYRLFFLPYLWYAFFPAILIFQHSTLFARKWPAFWSSFPVQLGKGVITLIIFCAVAYFSFDRRSHDLQQINYLADRRQWDRLLQEMLDHPVNHRLALFQTYRALSQKGMLLSELFSIPFRERALKSFFMTKEFALTAALPWSDFLLDIGNINESEHWAHEALALYGETPQVLLRLFQVNFLKGNRDFAAMCLQKLASNPLYRRQSRQLGDLLQNPSRAGQNPVLASAGRKMFKMDYPHFTYRISENLENMVNANPDNRDAFEYLMVYSLLTGGMNIIEQNIETFRTLGYTSLPRHIEEAAVLLLANKNHPDPRIGSYTISSNTLKRFSDYNKILAAHRGDRATAEKELYRKHGNTYWFYSMFIRPKELRKSQKESTEDIQ